jgi:hypothetical protein
MPSRDLEGRPRPLPRPPRGLVIDPKRLVIRVCRLATHQNPLTTETIRLRPTIRPLGRSLGRLRFVQTHSGEEIRARCTTIRSFTIVLNVSLILRRFSMAPTNNTCPNGWTCAGGECVCGGPQAPPGLDCNDGGTAVLRTRRRRSASDQHCARRGRATPAGTIGARS